MTTQENQRRSENDARFGSTEPPRESGTGASKSDQPRGNRRRFLQGIGVVGTISLAGCTEVTISEDGITWEDGDGATGTSDDGATSDGDVLGEDGSTEEDDEIDLSEYEDGCFSGGTPAWSEGVRDGVEITVSPAGVEDRIELIRETIQFEMTEDLQVHDGVELIPSLVDEENDDDLILEAELVEIDEDDDDVEYLEAELIFVDEEDDDE